MYKTDLEFIAQCCERLQAQPVPHLAMPIGDQRRLQTLVFKWAVENGIEVPLGAKPYEVKERRGYP